MLFVVYTERKDSIRLISARLATKAERSIYYDKDSIKPVSEPISKPILHKKQQRTEQTLSAHSDGRVVAELN